MSPRAALMSASMACAMLASAQAASPTAPDRTQQVEALTAAESFGASAPQSAPDSFFLSGSSPFKAQLQQLVHDAGVDRSTREILGPFSDVADRITEALYDSVLPSSTTNSLHWVFLVITLVLATGLFYMRGRRGAKDADGRERACGLVEYLFPARIYRHPSARVDVGLYLIDRALMPVWALAFLGALAPWIERTTIHGLQSAFGASPALPITTGWKLTYGAVTLLVADAFFFFTHYAMHRTRIGWAIHKVHHSAEVLTPLTRFREHFLEGPIFATTAAAAAALSSGTFAYLFAGGITQITIMNLGVFSFLYALNGNFRHYHVSFRYPPWLERWLQSPGMHHTHHSVLPQHWDSNLGLVTSVWDRLFGTLYIAGRYEETPWGLAAEDQARCTTLAQNLLAPFRAFRDMAREW